MEDQILVAQILKGNKNAFKLLVIRYQRPLFSFFRKFGLSPQKIEELAQDVFLKTYSQLHTLDFDKGSFSSWMFAIARNHAINELKKKGEWLESEESLEQLSFKESDSLSLENIVSRKLTEQTIHGFVQKVPNPFKIPLILSYINELTLEEIAAMEQCSLGTVKSRIHRGKLFLKNLLLSEDYV